MVSATRTRLACLLSVSNDNRRPTIADALADIGRPNPDRDWLLSDKLDEQLKRFKAEVAAERVMFTDDYGRSL